MGQPVRVWGALMPGATLSTFIRRTALSEGDRFSVWLLESRPHSGGSVPRCIAPTDEPLHIPVADLVGHGGAQSQWVLKAVSDHATHAGDGVKALRDEARLQSAVQHPSIVPIVSVIELGGHNESPPSIGLITRWMPAGSLDTVISDHFHQPQIDDIIGGLTDVGRALAALHQAGIVHGDVAPGNMLIGDDGTHALTDFGCAEVVGAVSEGDTATDASVRVERSGIANSGTPGYAAPEVVAGDPLTFGSDIFSLGAVGLAWLERVEPEVSAPDEATGSVTEIVRAWCRELASEASADRPRDLGSAVDALVGLTCGVTMQRSGAPRRVRVRTVEFGPRPPAAGAVVAGERPDRRRRILAGCAVVLVLVASGWWVSGRQRNAPVRTNPHRLSLAAGSVRCPAAGSARRVTDSPPVLADVIGSGCAQELTWNHQVLVVRDVTSRRGAVSNRRYTIGRAGDVLFVAEWGCRGGFRPRIYRPSTGEIITYRSLPRRVGEPGAVMPDPPESARTHGHPVVTHDGRGCARLTVTA